MTLFYDDAASLNNLKTVLADIALRRVTALTIASAQYIINDYGFHESVGIVRGAIDDCVIPKYTDPDYNWTGLNLVAFTLFLVDLENIQSESKVSIL